MLGREPMYAYKMMPVDVGWENLKTVEETVAELASRFEVREDLIPHEVIDQQTPVCEFISRWEHAKHFAAKVGWDGDFRGPPYVFWLPCEGEFSPAFVFKHDNNGATFVVSGQPLPAVYELSAEAWDMARGLTKTMNTTTRSAT